MFLLVLTTCLLWPSVAASRHDRLRSLNELLVESQSVHDLPAFVTKLSARPNSSGAAHGVLPGMIAPKKKQTREKKLRRLMGKDFDERWMTLTEPKVKVTQERSKLAEIELMSEVSAVNASIMLGDNKGLATLNPQLSKVIEKWLLQRASCPVTFVWDDLGNLFWPRWVKKGVCGADKEELERKYGRRGYMPPLEENTDSSKEKAEKSCSWPAGMHCVPSDSHAIRLMRWHCYPRGQGGRRKDGKDGKPDRKSRRTRIRCTWIKVPYPVTSECFCSC